MLRSLRQQAKGIILRANAQLRDLRRRWLSITVVAPQQGFAQAAMSDEKDADHRRAR